MPLSTRCLAAIVGVAMLLLPGVASAQELPPSDVPDEEPAVVRTFPSGYTIANDDVFAFFNEHGGAATFGEPISGTIGLLDYQVQLFQRAALQVRSDGSVEPLQLTADGLLPYTHLNSLTVPAPDPVLSLITPSPDQTSYTRRVDEFLRATVPDVWNGQRVQFLATYAGTTGSNDVLSGVPVWGMPTSAPAVDPNNPQLIYQRFQNGILMFNATTRSTTALPMGEYLKSVLTGRDVPMDLAQATAASPLFGQLAF